MMGAIPVLRIPTVLRPKGLATRLQQGVQTYLNRYWEELKKI